jgi:hypothetical protein
MNHKINVGFLCLVSSLSSCFSSKAMYQPEFEPSVVLERMSDREETPEWTQGEATLVVEKNDLTFIAVTRLGGDARPDACMNVAAENARAAILRQIQDNVSKSGQVNDQDASSDPGVESLMVFLSQGKLSGVKVTDRYWEKRLESDTAGQRVLRIHCAAKVAISRFMLEKNIRSVLNGSPAGDPQIRQRLLDSHKSFIDATTKKEVENTRPDQASHEQATAQ